MVSRHTISIGISAYCRLVNEPPDFRASYNKLEILLLQYHLDHNHYILLVFHYFKSLNTKVHIIMLYPGFGFFVMF